MPGNRAEPVWVERAGGPALRPGWRKGDRLPSCPRLPLLLLSVP